MLISIFLINTLFQFLELMPSAERLSMWM